MQTLALSLVHQVSARTVSVKSDVALLLSQNVQCARPIIIFRETKDVARAFPLCCEERFHTPYRV